MIAEQARFDGAVGYFVSVKAPTISAGQAESAIDGHVDSLGMFRWHDRSKRTKRSGVASIDLVASGQQRSMSVIYGQVSLCVRSIDDQSPGLYRARKQRIVTGWSRGVLARASVSLVRALRRNLHGAKAVMG